MQLTITITAEHVTDLQDFFGPAVDIPAKIQALVNDWLVQFQRQREEKQRLEDERLFRDGFPAAPTTVKDQVRTLLKPTLPKP